MGNIGLATSALWIMPGTILSSSEVLGKYIRSSEIPWIGVIDLLENRSIYS